LVPLGGKKENQGKRKKRENTKLSVPTGWENANWGGGWGKKGELGSRIEGEKGGKKRKKLLHAERRKR